MRLIFRADGNATIGLGHLVRSLALADMVRSVGECWFAVQAPSAAVRQLLATAQVRLLELPPTTDLPAEAAWLAEQQVRATDVVVLDGYQFDATYRQQLRSRGCRLAVIDDMRLGHFEVELIINHSPGVTPQLYDAAPYTRFCLGPAFSLLRMPFLTNARPPEATHLAAWPRCWPCRRCSKWVSLRAVPFGTRRLYNKPAPASLLKKLLLTKTWMPTNW
jgi:spore coat polysaccharide biosynthesis predicted glycosyltransferase SpsG